jgi:hypothetical protein
MPKFHSIIPVEASQWFKNGDHPLDYSKSRMGFKDTELISYSPEYRKEHKWEGDIVRYFRHPGEDGCTKCPHCSHMMDIHGWIDKGDFIVCPGDWIITGADGIFYPCKPDIFSKTYEIIPDIIAKCGGLDTDSNCHRARVIAGEGGEIYGIVVRIKPEDNEASAKKLAITALMDYNSITNNEAVDYLSHMHPTVQTYRWIPRRDSSGIRPYIEEAEAGSRGSWLGIYWTFKMAR